ncbi:peptidoglycan recognition protein family protein [Streptomyces sp. H39-S7]|uniref:peptidoglycan recognition protein family protein n=1 Tax=Streptomyces sp. H39-S7 TaxID=3004357 RepID=UPI0022B041ED|nr:peptidoglycan recognition protein [Streptomyces sp. H39-S7]MCZ4122838.1 peptidoglycan recognition protein [Streptomyces sp. H39-S7]
MRAFLATTIGVACTAALALPFAVPTGAAAHSGGPARPAHKTTSQPPGSTRALPLVPLVAPLATQGTDRAPGAPAEQGLSARQVAPFSLLGVTWNNPAAHLDATVQVRTRASGTATWSGWQDVQAHSDDGPDPGDRVGRGATAPLWVGASDGVQVRVRPGAGGEPRAGSGTKPAPLPFGLRLEMVDPGDDGPADPTAPVATPAAPAAPPSILPAPVTPGVPVVIPAAPGTPTAPAPGTEPGTTPATTPGTTPATAPGTTPATDAPSGLEFPALTQEETVAAAGGVTHVGPRPRIVTRAGWGADEKLRESGFGYTGTVKVVFVHHTATGNDYACSGAPAVIRSIYRYHVESSGWRDIGYNFLIDKCGNIYEGRAGGVAKPVMGAHTMGFNTDSSGVAVLGTFTSASAPAASVKAVAQLAAWKLGLHGGNPTGTTHLVSGGANLYKKGSSVKLNVISGHRDGFATECPGAKLYGQLGGARKTAADLQGR